MSERSKEWDKKENNRPNSANFMKKFLGDKRFRDRLNEAENMYAAHKKPGCRMIHLLIRQDRSVEDGDFFIEILECRDCGWNYHKKWWKFW